MRSWLCRETMDELKAVPSTVDAPHLVNIVVGGKTPMVPTKELGDMGFSLVLYANVALQAAVQGMTLALRALKDGGDVSETSGLVTSGNPAPINAQLPTAATNRLAVTEVAVVQTCHPSRYTRLRLSIP